MARNNSKMRNCIRSIVLLHPILLTGVIMLLLFIFAFMFCWIAVEIDMRKCVRAREFLGYLYTEWNIETGLSLLCGYLGMAATIVLGLIALRYSFKTEERKRIEQFHNTRIKRIRFYDMFDDFVPSKLRYDDIKKYQFFLEIALTGDSADFDFLIERVWWGNLGDRYQCNNMKKLNHCKTYIENEPDTVIYIYFDEFEPDYEKKKVSFFYHIRDYEPLLLQRSMRYRWIQLDMRAREKVWIKNQVSNEFTVDFKILVENRNDRKENENWVELHEVRHNIEIDNANK